MSPALFVKCIEARYTSRANPRRGYHDSEVVVTFEGGTEDERRQFMERLREEKARENMWAYPAERHGADVWSINYGYDSGD